MLNTSVFNKNTPVKGKNNTRSGVCSSLKGGSFITPKIKYTGHH